MRQDSVVQSIKLPELELGSPVLGAADLAEGDWYLGTAGAAVGGGAGSTGGDTCGVAAGAVEVDFTNSSC